MSDLETLWDACEAIVDCAHRTAPIDPNGQYFAVGTPAMRGNRIDYGEARRIDRATFDSWTERLRPEFGDLLLAREAPVGPVVAIPPEENVAPGQRTVLLRPRRSVADSRFLFYYLTWSATQSALAVKASGSTVPHLNVADVRSFRLTGIPGVDDQRAIAEVLGALDDKIAANDRIVSLTKDLLASSFAALGIDRQPERDEQVLHMADVVQLNPPETLPRLEDVVYLAMKNLPDSAMTVAEWSRRDARGGARFKNGDTLLARITPCLENGKTGYVDYLDTDEEVAVGSTEFIVMRPMDGIPTVLPYFLATSDRFREFAIRHMVGTSGRQRLAASDLHGLALSRPDSTALRAFGELASPLMARVRSCVGESRVLARTRDELLPLLMSGKLQIKDAEAVVSDVV